MLEKRQDIIEKLIFSFDSESNVEICYLAHICQEYELYYALIYICTLKNDFLRPIDILI